MLGAWSVVACIRCRSEEGPAVRPLAPRVFLIVSLVGIPLPALMFKQFESYASFLILIYELLLLNQIFLSIKTSESLLIPIRLEGCRMKIRS